MELGGLVAGLGNPGARYAGTRHNCGFAFADALLADCREKTQVEALGGQKFFCSLWRVKLPVDGSEWLVAKPETFMNDSGKCVQALLSWYKLAPGRLVVAHDELDIPCGELRFKKGGGNAGHNGLRSIDQWLGTPDYARLRIGIGKPEGREAVLNWVLGKPDKIDAPLLAASVPAAVDVFYEYLANGAGAAAGLAKKIGKEIDAS